MTDNDELLTQITQLQSKQNVFRNFIDNINGEINEIDAVCTVVDNILSTKNRDLRDVKSAIESANAELARIRNVITYSVDVQESTIPYIVHDDGLVEYHLYINERIDTIIRNDVRWKMPKKYGKIMVNGFIYITVNPDSKRVSRIVGSLSNFIHQSGDEEGQLCTGAIHVQNVDTLTAERLRNQCRIANLDSPMDSDKPVTGRLYRILEKMEEDGVEHTYMGERNGTEWNLH